MMRVNAPHSDAPSTRAASSSSLGRVWMNCLSRKMPITSARPGRMTPANVLTSLSLVIIRYSGTSVTWPGIISAARIIQKNRFEPGNFFLANA